jgi:imidazolonepropionase
LEVGLRADLAAWDIQNPAELAYWLGKPVLHARWLDGVRS